MNSLAYRLAATALVLLPAIAAGQDSTRRPVLRLDSAQKQLAFSVMKEMQESASQDPAKAFAEHLFAPELVMQHQAKLKITQAQRNVIVAEINKLQAAAVQVQWNVAEEAQKLTELLERETIGEAEALAQADRLMGYETTVKHAQLAMLIRIRNVLTGEQRAMLLELRARRDWSKHRE